MIEENRFESASFNGLSIPVLIQSENDLNEAVATDGRIREPRAESRDHPVSGLSGIRTRGLRGRSDTLACRKPSHQGTCEEATRPLTLSLFARPVTPGGTSVTLNRVTFGDVKGAYEPATARRRILMRECGRMKSRGIESVGEVKRDSEGPAGKDLKMVRLVREKSVETYGDGTFRMLSRAAGVCITCLLARISPTSGGSWCSADTKCPSRLPCNLA